jgi:hypothetical protein
MKKSKVKKNVVKLTVIRDSQYDRYMKKFQPKATCQCRAINARSIRPVRSDFSLLKTLKIFRNIWLDAMYYSRLLFHFQNGLQDIEKN